MTCIPYLLTAQFIGVVNLLRIRGFLSHFLFSKDKNAFVEKDNDRKAVV